MPWAWNWIGAAAAQGQPNPQLTDLLEQFRRTTVFWLQFDVAKEIARTGDDRVLKELESLLASDDRHLRGNAAFVFASLGDPRGFETIRTMLTDRSYRPLGQGISGGSFNPAAPDWWLGSQIEADRYYAVHLLGELKSARAVDALIPLLDDRNLDYNVAWALGEIGDPGAIAPLIAALDNRDALMRVSAIQALQKLKATEAIPQLRALLNDQALPSAGNQISVGETAKAAIATLEQGR
jgi:HEAT repeat protein